MSPTNTRITKSQAKEALDDEAEPPAQRQEPTREASELRTASHNPYQNAMTMDMSSKKRIMRSYGPLNDEIELEAKRRKRRRIQNVPELPKTLSTGGSSERSQKASLPTAAITEAEPAVAEGPETASTQGEAQQIAPSLPRRRTPTPSRDAEIHNETADGPNATKSDGLRATDRHSDSVLVNNLPSPI